MANQARTHPLSRTHTPSLSHAHTLSLTRTHPLSRRHAHTLSLALSISISRSLSLVRALSPSRSLAPSRARSFLPALCEADHADPSADLPASPLEDSAPRQPRLPPPGRHDEWQVLLFCFVTLKLSDTNVHEP